jgi:uncharacterized membrane protein (DUF2068 family)
MNRPRSYTIAAVLQLLISIFAIVLFVPALALGSDSAADAPPFALALAAFAAGVLGLLSAYGVWRNQKWGVVLTIVIRALDGLAALPGILFAPTPFMWASSVVFIVASVAIIGLLLWPKPKRMPVSNNAA